MYISYIHVLVQQYPPLSPPENAIYFKHPINAGVNPFKPKFPHPIKWDILIHVPIAKNII